MSNLVAGCAARFLQEKQMHHISCPNFCPKDTRSYTPYFLQTLLPGWIFLVCPEGRASIRVFGGPSCGSSGASGELSMQLAPFLGAQGGSGGWFWMLLNACVFAQSIKLILN